MMTDFLDGCCQICDFMGNFKTEVSTDGKTVYTNNNTYRCDKCDFIAHRFCHSERSKMSIEDRSQMDYCCCGICGHKIEFSQINHVVNDKSGELTYTMDVISIIDKSSQSQSVDEMYILISNMIEYIISHKSDVQIYSILELIKYILNSNQHILTKDETDAIYEKYYKALKTL